MVVIFVPEIVFWGARTDKASDRRFGGKTGTATSYTRLTMESSLGADVRPKVHVATPTVERVFCVACHWVADNLQREPVDLHQSPAEQSGEGLLEQRRAHYRSDWHRVNLKRRVAQLPPLTLPEFEERMRIGLGDGSEGAGVVDLFDEERPASRAEQPSGYRIKVPANLAGQEPNELSETHSASQHRGPFGKKAGHSRAECIWCQKQFASERALFQHERSARHQDKLRELGIANQGVETAFQPSFGMASAEQMDVDAWVRERLQEARPLDVNECLFCSETVVMTENAPQKERDEALMANLHHMAREHSFFVPYIDYCCDVEGLIRYLGTKVGLGFCCIYGGNEVSLERPTAEPVHPKERSAEMFRSLQACRNHMRDLGHCKLPDFDEEEVWNEYQEFYSFTPVRSRAEPQRDTNEGLDPLESADERDDSFASAEAPWEHRVMPLDGSKSLAAANEEPIGLQVGQYGRIAGHRSLWRYYRQHLVTNERLPFPVVIAKQEQQRMVDGRRAAVHIGPEYRPATVSAQRQGSIPPRYLLERWRRAQLAQALRNDAARRGGAPRSAIAVLNSGYRG